MEKLEKIQQKCIYLKEEISETKQKLSQDKRLFFQNFKLFHDKSQIDQIFLEKILLKDIKN